MSPTHPARFHVSLRVRDLDASVAFYERLLGVPPARRESDYAKFEPAEPAVVLSLLPGNEPGLDHLGVRVAAGAPLEAERARLRAAGLAADEEREVDCCYSVQDKLWVHDPDGRPWEVYALLPAESRAQVSGCCAETGGCKT